MVGILELSLQQDSCLILFRCKYLEGKTFNYFSLHVRISLL